MNDAQEKAGRALKRALAKVRDAHMSLRVYDGSVWVVPSEVNLWPQGDSGNVFEVLEAYGMDVRPDGLEADGGAGV